MLNIPLQAVPNQSLSVLLDGNNYEIKIKSIGDELMAIDIVKNNVSLIEGQRMVPSFFLIPYGYKGQDGNFSLITDNNEYPFYELFGISQSLLYFSPEDIAAL